MATTEADWLNVGYFDAYEYIAGCLDRDHSYPVYMHRDVKVMRTADRSGYGMLTRQDNTDLYLLSVTTSKRVFARALAMNHPVHHQCVLRELDSHDYRMLSTHPQR